MYETPSLHKFGYSSEQLKLREYQELKDLIKSQEKLAQITHSKLKEDLQRDFENDIENQVEVRNLKFMSQVGQAGMILNEDEINNILNSLDQNKITITNNIIQLLYDKGLFDSFPNKDQAFANYLTFSETYLLEKYGKTIPTSDGEYYLSDLEYSTRQSILESLKKDNFKDLVDMKHRMKLTPTEINFILYD